MDNKTYKVAKIISETALVINAGSEQGINKGDKFQIIGKYGTTSVIDPDTGQDLGTLDDIKGTVKASKIYPHMTVCTSQYIPDTTNSLIAAITQNNAMAHPSLSLGTGHYEPLNVDKTQITGEIQNSSLPIQIGDIARLTD